MKASSEIPLSVTAVPAGFPSPAEDYIDRHLCLDDLVKNPASTFMFRTEGQSMYPLIREDNLLVVDRSIEAAHGLIVVADHEGERTVKRLAKRADGIWLIPENPEYQSIKCSEETHIFGVVYMIIHFP